MDKFQLPDIGFEGRSHSRGHSRGQSGGQSRGQSRGDCRKPKTPSNRKALEAKISSDVNSRKKKLSQVREKAATLQTAEGDEAKLNVGYKNDIADIDYKTDDANIQRITDFIAKPSHRVKALEELHELPEVKSFLAAITNKKDGRSEKEFFELQERAAQDCSPSKVAIGRQKYDVNKYLGDRSRFGDGDGSYWDRWLTTVGVEGGEGSYVIAKMPQNSMYSSGVVAPRSGMKVMRTRTEGLERVLPYAERRRAHRTKTHQRLDSSRSVPDILPGKLKRGQEQTVDFTLTKPVGEGEDFYIPIKGESKSSPCNPRNYFGKEAKADFFDYFKQVSRQRGRYLSLEQVNLGEPVLASGLQMDSSSDEDSFADMTKSASTFSLRTNSVKNNLQKRSRRTIKENNMRTARGINVPSLSPLNLLTEDNPILAELEKPEEDIKDTTLEDLHKSPEAIGSFNQATARTRFLFGCVEASLAPRANLILRKIQTKQVNLAHQGMGDELGSIFAKCLQDLPLVAQLNLMDNRLTDASLVPLLDAVAQRNDILELNLSQNKMDEEASNKLMEYLRLADCSLTSLILSKSDVDDDECSRLIQSLAKNPYCSRLDLSHNLIGQKENMNVVDPDYTTGGEALAQTLSMPYCNLKYLDVSWNLIRLESAVALGDCLIWNKNLEHLNLAYNAFGQEGGEAIGKSLHKNSTLKELNLSNNSITPRAAFVLAVALRMNEGLRRIDLNGNPLGKLGGTTLMTIPSTAHHRIEIGTKACNFSLNEANLDFNPENPKGEYLLDMDKGYDHAVLLEILRLAAFEEGCRIEKAVHIDKSSNTESELKLVRRRSEEQQEIDNRDYFDGDPDELFQKIDADGSNMIDKTELTNMFHNLGLFGSDAEIQRIMEYYDKDNSGTIDRDEFQDICKFMEQELKEKTRSTRYIASQGSTSRWLPPDSGQIKITVDFVVKHSEDFDVFTQQHHRNVMYMVKEADDRAKMIEMALHHMRLQTTEGDLIYKELLHEYGSKEKAMSQVLPSMAAPRYARLLISSNMKTPQSRRLLRQKMGSALGPILGMITGHYHLDLGKNMDRLAFNKVVGINNLEKSKAEKSGMFDTSQSGDFHNIRNFKYNGAKTKVEISFLTAPPPKGIVEFDYVETSRPSTKDKPVSHNRFIGILRELEIISEIQADVLKAKGSLAEVTCNEHVPKIKRDRHFYVALAQFYSDPLPQPGDDRSDYVPPPINDTKLQAANKLKSGIHVLMKVQNMSSRSLPSTPQPQEGRSRSNSRVSSRSSSRSGSRASSRSGSKKSRRKRSGKQSALIPEEPIIPEDSLEALSTRTVNAKLAANRDMLIETQTAFVDRYFTCEQIRFVLQKYPVISELTDLAVSCFPRILDLRNFSTILEVLSQRDQAHIIARLGLLNTWNPMEPDGYIEVDLSRREERQVARVLVHLAKVEPGENFMNESFRWTRMDSSLPGWELPVTWFSEESMPHRGILAVEYYSGEGKNLKGCSPDIRLRSALTTALTLCELDPPSENIFPTVDSARACILTSLSECGLLLDYTKGVASVSNTQPDNDS